MSKTNDFTHLHLHTHASLLDGLGLIDEYLERAHKIGQKAIGISDHGNLYGVYELLKKTRENDMIGLPGIEFYVAPQHPKGAKNLDPVFYGPNGQQGKFDVAARGSYTHQTVWAINNVGLKNLYKLSTMSFQQEHFRQKPRIDFEMLAEHSEGLVVATGCPSSEISTRLLLDQEKEAYEYTNRMKEVFGDRLFVEIMNHNMSSPIEKILLPKQLKLAKKFGLPLLATNDAHYSEKHDHVHHEQMLCSQSGARMSDKTWDEGGPRFAFDGDQFYLKTAEEMAMLFPEEDFPNALTNTLLITEMAEDITIDFDPTLKPKAFIPDGETEASYFKKLINKGLANRYKNAPAEIQEEAKERAKTEFEVIHSSDFIGYFLTVREYIEWTRNNFSTTDENGDILALPTGTGRGSVGGSIVAYLLNISEVDPIKHDLLFERFLTAGRGETYEIIYDDGSREEIIVSGTKTLENNENKYVHQLEVGDVVLVEDTDDDSDEDEVKPEPAKKEPRKPVPKKDYVKRQESRKESKPLSIDLGVVPQEKLSDITKIPF